MFEPGNCFLTAQIGREIGTGGGDLDLKNRGTQISEKDVCSIILLFGRCML